LIKVTVMKDRITVKGHAGYAQAGKDIVCAGVSALTQTFIKSIEDLTVDSIQYEISPGRVDIKYGNLSEKAIIMKDSFIIGISLIADEYPDFVRVV
jgi:uncharacterized protein YsxB (DUF464 family)